jgi:hypothetical protein
MSIGSLARLPSPMDQRSFLLQRAQPAMTGLIDGSLSTLAPVFAVAFATHHPIYAFFAGLATATGAGVSMAFSEGLSDTGELTGCGNPYLRGSITGAGTFLGGVLHTLPFLMTRLGAARSPGCHSAKMRRMSEMRPSFRVNFFSGEDFMHLYDELSSPGIKSS